MAPTTIHIDLRDLTFSEQVKWLNAVISIKKSLLAKGFQVVTKKAQPNSCSALQPKTRC
jgi:hypothetical protein